MATETHQREPLQWQWGPALLAAVAATFLLVAAISQRAALGNWQWAFYGGALLILLATAGFWRRVSVAERSYRSAQERVHSLMAELREDRTDLQQLRETIQAETRRQTDALASREQAFADKLATYQEWMEFPTPIDLRHQTYGPARPGPQLLAPNSDMEDAFAGVAESDEHLTDGELTDLIAKDRQLLELLNEETRILFDKIARNEYSVDGQIQIGTIWTDIQTLTERVARIYIGESIETPLLQTNLARILRAGSRAMLQLLVVLEELPLDVKEYNLNQVYGYVRKGVRAYGYYRSAEPYFPAFNSAYYLGRVALGANPFTMGTWWVVTQLGKRGANQLATRIINRQALVFLQNVVKVIGFEVASIYGSDFRRRDPNWIYAVELTELVSHFPLTQNSLSHALKEIGSLQLRSEYDRIFLYRCLAEHRSAEPQRYRASRLLHAEERQAIVRRLEKFMETFIRQPPGNALTDWTTGVERRLAVRIRSELSQPAKGKLDQADSALRTLASFLLEVKQIEPSELSVWLSKTRSWLDLPETRRQLVLQQLQENPPFFLEQPDVEPESNSATRFVEDLCQLTVHVLPRSRHIDETAADLAAFVRIETDQFHETLDQTYIQEFVRHLSTSSPVRDCPGEVARAALNLIGENESQGFLYRNVRVEQIVGRSAPADIRNGKENWLLGTADRLVLLHVASDEPRVVWEGTDDVKHTKASQGLFTTECRLVGGQWQGTEEMASLDNVLRIPTPSLRRYDDYFQPLMQFLLKNAPSEADDD